MARYDLTEFERKVIQPLLPNKTRRASRMDSRRVGQAGGRHCRCP